jgi:hypothetical protein
MIMTDTVTLFQPGRELGFSDDCTLCDAPATIIVAMTPNDFSSTSCNHCGGERAFCDTHWNEFVTAITNAGKKEA